MSDDVIKGYKIGELKASIIEYGMTLTTNIPNSPKVNVDAITADDDNPMFVILEICRTGISKNNNRRYSRSNMIELANLTPGVMGYLGHPDPMKTGFEFRDPHNIYVGAMVEDLQDGGARCLGKTYLFKSSPLREWVPKSIAAGNPMTVSINAIGDVMRLPDGTLEVLSINELESIDWANPGTEGVGTARAMDIVSEMQNTNNQKDGGNDMAERNEIIKGITVAELKAYNPNSVTEIIRGISVAELQSANPDLFKAVQETGKIVEMKLIVEGNERIVKLDDVQGIISAQDMKISELQDRLTAQLLDGYKTRKINELVPENLREYVSKRVIGTSEKQIDDSITAEMAYIQELQKIGSVPGNPVKQEKSDLIEGFKQMFAMDKDKKK